MDKQKAVFTGWMVLSGLASTYVAVDTFNKTKLVDMNVIGPAAVALISLVGAGIAIKKD